MLLFAKSLPWQRNFARSRGIVAFTADVLATNSHMLHIFHKGAPAPIESRLEDGVYRLRFALEPG